MWPFRQPTEAEPGQFKLSTTFLFELESSQLVPEAMKLDIVDP